MHSKNESMLIAIIGLFAVGLGMIIYVLQSQGAKPRIQVKVTEVVDARSVKVEANGNALVVKLAGIGYPDGDERSFEDGRKLIEGLAVGRTFEMEVLSERDEERYVILRSLGGESLNELMLSLGFARYAAVGIGFNPPLLAAEEQARSNRKGLWNANRELFRNAANSFEVAESPLEKGQPAA